MGRGDAPIYPLDAGQARRRSEEHTSELQSRPHLVCRLLLEKKNRRLTRRAELERGDLLREAVGRGPAVLHALQVRGPGHPARPLPRHRGGDRSLPFRGVVVCGTCGYVTQNEAVSTSQRVDGASNKMNPSAPSSARASSRGLLPHEQQRDVGEFERLPPLFFSNLQPPPRSTLFPYTTLFR